MTHQDDAARLMRTATYASVTVALILIVMKLVAWIENEVGAEIDPGDVVIENFERPAAIVAFVDTLGSTTATR